MIVLAGFSDVWQLNFPMGLSKSFLLLVELESPDYKSATTLLSLFTRNWLIKYIVVSVLWSTR